MSDISPVNGSKPEGTSIATLIPFISLMSSTVLLTFVLNFPLIPVPRRQSSTIYSLFESKSRLSKSLESLMKSTDNRETLGSIFMRISRLVSASSDLISSRAFKQ